MIFSSVELLVQDRSDELLLQQIIYPGICVANPGHSLHIIIENIPEVLIFIKKMTRLRNSNFWGERIVIEKIVKVAMMIRFDISKMKTTLISVKFPLRGPSLPRLSSLHVILDSFINDNEY